MKELRCDNRLHGIMVRPGVFEVVCRNPLCGGGKGTAVLHQFDVKTGRLIETKMYKSPNKKEA